SPSPVSRLECVSDPETARLARFALAMRLVDEFRQRQAAGTAERIDQFLAAHADLRVILSPLLTDGIAAGAAAPAEDLPAAADEPVPTAIGPYRILQQLGKGGMGHVYLAERSDPRQRVAVKVMRPGLDTRALVARFERERKALAMMNHDAIAKVFDAGI